MIRDEYVEVYDWQGRPLGHVQERRIHPRLLADLHGRHACPLCDGDAEATASLSSPTAGSLSPETRGDGPGNYRDDLAPTCCVSARTYIPPVPHGEVGEMIEAYGRGGPIDGFRGAVKDQCHVRQISEPTRLGSSDAND